MGTQIAQLNFYCGVLGTIMGLRMSPIMGSMMGPLVGLIIGPRSGPDYGPPCLLAPVFVSLRAP